MGAPAPYRFELAPRVSRAEVRLIAALRAHALPWEADALARQALERTLGGALPVAFGPARVLAGEALAESLPPDVVLLERSDGRVLGLALAPELALGLCARVLGDPEAELPAPRALTPAERGIVRYLAGAALDALGAADLRVGPVVAPERALALLGSAAMLELRLPGGWLRIFVPETLLAAPPPVRPQARYLADAGRARLGAVPISFRAGIGAARLSRAELAGLEPGDVIVLDLTRARLAAGRVHFPGTAASGADRAEIVIHSEEPLLKAQPDPTRPLIDELPVEVVAELGRVTLSARAALELGPGSVVILGSPLGGPVELTAHGKTIARGELVVVDDQLGVRVTELTVRCDRE